MWQGILFKRYILHLRRLSVCLFLLILDGFAFSWYYRHWCRYGYHHDFDDAGIQIIITYCFRRSTMASVLTLEIAASPKLTIHASRRRLPLGISKMPSIFLSCLAYSAAMALLMLLQDIERASLESWSGDFESGLQDYSHHHFSIFSLIPPFSIYRIAGRRRHISGCITLLCAPSFISIADFVSRALFRATLYLFWDIRWLKRYSIVSIS